MFRRLLEEESACGGGPGMAILHIFCSFSKRKIYAFLFFTTASQATISSSLLCTYSLEWLPFSIPQCKMRREISG